MQQWYKCPQCNQDIRCFANPCPNCECRLAWSQEGPSYLPPPAAQSIYTAPSEDLKQSRPVSSVRTTTGWGVGSAFALLYYSLASFPIAGLTWGLMWFTDRLYEWGVGLIAVPIRIITFIMQLGVLLGCLGTVIGIVWITASIFYSASHGQAADGESKLSVKGYMLLLLIPVAMEVAGLLVGLFHNWLNFGEHGLGLITLGYIALNWVLENGSLVIILVWLVILPIFLRRRNA